MSRLAFACIGLSSSLSFEEWKTQYAVVFPKEEQADRRAIFEANDQLILESNARGLPYSLSHNQFSAHTAAEYLALLGFQNGTEAAFPNLGEHIARNAAVPSSIDWTQMGAVTPVKNQGDCASGWAFATTGGTEGQWAIAAGSLQSLSEQQLLDCSKQNDGCSGGNMDNSFSFYMGTNIASESSYPYKASDGTCRPFFTTAIPRGAVTGYLGVSDEVELLNAVGSTGPVSVAIEADQSSFQFYSSGVLTGDCGQSLDHSLLIVGYGSDAAGLQYWKVKNSWGTSWGMDGYILIERGVNKCGIADAASYPTIATVTVV